MPSQTNDRLTILDQIQPGDTQFTTALVREVHAFGKSFSAEADERWSLIDCGLTADHWAKVLSWARACRTSDLPTTSSRSAGLLLLMISSAVARSLDREEPLWQMVAESCSQPLRQAWFNSNDYPVDELRGAVHEVCNALALRNQLDLPGKHRYWRTVQLQFGFSARVAAARLPYWLAGYSVPETIKALLSEDDLNCSDQFRTLWSSLGTWHRDQSNRDAENKILLNPWYPREAHTLIKEGLVATRDTGLSELPRAEDEEAVSSILGGSRFRVGEFQIGLGSILPYDISSSRAPVLSLYIEGMGIGRLVRDDQGRQRLEDGYFSAPAEEVLDCPTREVSVSGRSGVIYKERFSFWPLDSDLVLFRGNAGRLVTNLERLAPESGCPYVCITSEAVDLGAGPVPLEHDTRGRDWKLYSFPHGFPAGLEARIEGLRLWSPEHAQVPPSTAGFSLFVRERSISSIELSASAPPGWTIQRVRFAGQSFQGPHSIIDVSPASDYLKRKAQIYALQGANRHVLVVDAKRVGSVVPGAAVETEDGEWASLRPDALDAGEIEGRRMAVRWHNTADDPWLTLGQLPLARDPKILRRQHLRALGESLELRFGLMNESLAERIVLSSAVYSSGILADVSESPDLYVLTLRDAIEAALELRVWVWEDGSSEPRVLPRSEVEAHSDKRTLSTLQLSVSKPLGWAVSLEGEWLGGRFHVSAGSPDWQRLRHNWTSTLANTKNWPATAAALRWWRFPVLMDPFHLIVQEQARRHPLTTLLAWTAPDACPDMSISRSEAEVFASPIRRFFWHYAPAGQDAMMAWDAHADAILKAMEAGKVALPALLLLYSHPVLLARIVYEVLSSQLAEEERRIPLILDRSLFRKVQDPLQITALEAKYRSLYRIIRDFVERSSGVFAPDGKTSEALFQQSLSDLRSWNDRSPLDEAYFREQVIKPAEALFDGQPCDTKRLEIAVARSRACCAYITSHLLAIKGVRDRE